MTAQADRMAVFLERLRAEESISEAVEAIFRMGVDWARENLTTLRRRHSDTYRAQVARVAGELGTTSELLWHDGRTAKLCRQRWLAMWVLRRREHLSYPAIARAIRRDHSTVMHGCRRVEGDADLLARGRWLLEVGGAK